MIRFSVLTLFPEMVEATLREGVVGRALAQQLIELHFIRLRDFAKQDIHKSVDDRPYGGGDGMVMMPEPLTQAIQNAKSSSGLTRVIYLSPQGKKLDQKMAARLSQYDHLILLCGRYAGVDERVISNSIDEEISIGDYVLSGGELAAAVLIDVVARHKPGVLGHEASVNRDSFGDLGLLEAPLFTRPKQFEGQEVPEILLSGNHKNIERWRYLMSVYRTFQKRPDIWLSLTNQNPKLNSDLQDAKEMVAKLTHTERLACGIEKESL